MNDFDRFLETQLKDMLDHVVARQPPARRGRLEESDQSALPLLPAEGLGAEAIPVVAPVVTLPVAPGRL